MRKTVVSLVAVLALVAFASMAAAAAMPDFSGTWKWEKDGKTLVLELAQKVQKEKGKPPILVKGSHKATAEDGAKVDSSNGEISIFSDNFVDGAILVKIRSYACDAEGRAMMRLEGPKKDIMLFQIVSPPEGEHFIPEGNVYLKKVAPAPKATKKGK
jgi:hypothetical protein